MSAYDPEALEKARVILPNITYCATPYEAAQGADAVLLVTEWDEFREIDWNRLKNVVEHPLIVDGRNMFDAKDVTSHGFHYIGIGQPPLVSAATALTSSGVSTSYRKRFPSSSARQQKSAFDSDDFDNRFQN